MIPPKGLCQTLGYGARTQSVRLAEQLVIEFLDLAQRPRKPPRMNLIG
jgi:hypothetical protein